MASPFFFLLPLVYFLALITDYKVTLFIITLSVKKDVALTGRNSTGPPWSVTDNDDRCRRTSLVWPRYTVFRQASNKLLTLALYKLCICVFTELSSSLSSLLTFSLCFLSYLFTSFLVYFLIYLSTPFRIDPFHFQAGGRRRRPNLAVVIVQTVLDEQWLKHENFLYSWHKTLDQITKSMWQRWLPS